MLTADCCGSCPRNYHLVILYTKGQKSLWLNHIVHCSQSIITHSNIDDTVKLLSGHESALKTVPRYEFFSAESGGGTTPHQTQHHPSLGHSQGRSQDFSLRAQIERQ